MTANLHTTPDKSAANSDYELADAAALAEVIASYRGTVIDAQHLGRHEAEQRYTIGEAHHVSFPAPNDGLPSASFELVRRTDQGVVLLFAGSMTGDLALDGQRMTLVDLVARGHARSVGDDQFAYPLPNGARCRVHHGDLTFYVNVVAPNALTKGRRKPDRLLATALASSGAVLAGILGLAMLMPSDPYAIDISAEEVAQRFVGYSHMANALPPAPPVNRPDTGHGGPSGVGETPAAQPDEPGAAGDPTRVPEPGAHKPRIGPGKGVGPGPAGLTAMKRDGSNGQTDITDLFDPEDLTVLAGVDGNVFRPGADDGNLFDGVGQGAIANRGGGVGGIGLAGNGRGGGGDAKGTEGLGKVGLIGGVGKNRNGKPTLNYKDRGKGSGFGLRKPKQPKVRVAKGKIKGSADKKAIRRTVRNHINEIRFCYNRALERNPSADGRVAVQFSFAGGGQVTSAFVSQSSLDDAQAHKCITDAVRRWRFPAPTAGGIVIATYPFSFSPG